MLGLSRATRLTVLAGVLALACASVGCSANTPKETTAPQGRAGVAGQAKVEETATNSQGEPLYTPKYAPNGQETAVITTSKGVMTVQFYGTDAPIHVGNFIELARKGFYDGTKFHRYADLDRAGHYIIQGGDPQTKDLTSKQVVEALADGSVPLGMGGPGYVIKAEFSPETNPNKHVEGALAMARTSDPDSAGSQFYFCQDPQSFLDGQYTVFGKVTKGLDVMKSLRVGDVIEKVEIEGATE